MPGMENHIIYLCDSGTIFVVEYLKPVQVPFVDGNVFWISFTTQAGTIFLCPLPSFVCTQ